MSIRDFPLQFQNLQEEKDYYGQLVPYDDREFQLFYQLGMSDNQIRRLKVAVLKPRAAVFESPQIQVGTISKLLYHEMTSKYFLKLVVIVGNKTDEPMLKCKLSFEGDTGMSMWTKDIVVEKAGSQQKDEDGFYFLHGGQQLQQQVVVYYNRLPFSPIGGTFEWEDGMNRLKAQFTLPAMLLKFMNFLDVRVGNA